MADEPTENKKTQRVNVALKVTLTYADRDTFVERFAHNISRTGMFIRAKDPVPLGSRIRFDYLLSDHSRLMRGIGIVRWIRTLDESQDPYSPPGMGIEFIDLDPATEVLINEIVSQHGEGARAPKSARSSRTLAFSENVNPAPQSSRPDLDSEEMDALEALAEAMPGLETMDLNGATSDVSVYAIPPLRTLPEDTPLPTVGTPKAPTRPRTAPTLSTSAPVSTSLQPHVLFIDLSGTDFRAALGDMAHNASPQHRSSIAPRFESDGNGLRVGDAGAMCPTLASWLGRRWPYAAAASTARQVGLKLAESESGGIGLELGGGTVIAVEQAADRAIESLVAPILGSLPPDLSTLIMVPASNVKGATEALCAAIPHDHLGTLHVVPEAPALRAQGRLQIPDDGYGLVVHISLLETHVTLLSGAARILDAACLPDVGLWQTDELLLQHAGYALLREHGIDAEDDASLRNSLRGLIRRRRRDDETPPWDLELAGAHILVPRKKLVAWSERTTDRLMVACDMLMRQRSLLPKDLAGIAVASDEPFWPGLIQSFHDVLGVGPNRVKGGVWSRIAGALYVCQRNGLSDLLVE